MGHPPSELRELHQAFVECRTYGHAWDEFYPTDMRRPQFGFRLSLRCTRCTTQRHDTIDSNGNVGTREYIYPIDYKGAATGAMRTDLRLELHRRALQAAREKRGASKPQARAARPAVRAVPDSGRSLASVG